MYGPHARAEATREVILKIAVAHSQERALELFAREIYPSATSMAQGITGFAAGRPAVQPVVRLASCLIPKERVHAQVELLDAPGHAVPVDQGAPPARATAEPESASAAAAPSMAAQAFDRALPGCALRSPMAAGTKGIRQHWRARARRPGSYRCRSGTCPRSLRLPHPWSQAKSDATTGQASAKFLYCAARLLAVASPTPSDPQGKVTPSSRIFRCKYRGVAPRAACWVMRVDARKSRATAQARRRRAVAGSCVAREVFCG
jgi:hypothetical protein